MSSPRVDRKPWPMKWVALAIIVMIAGYTFLTLHYRRPGKAYQPYADMKERANTGRLLAAGYRRVVLHAARPTEAVTQPNTALPAPGGLPAELSSTIVSAPLLPTDILEVHAAATVAETDEYSLQFRCATSDDRRQLSAAELYVKGDEIVITPDFEQLSDGLQVRSREVTVAVSVPAGTLKPGSYRVTLVGENASRAWRLDVK
jgi:hypothetical protein